MKVYLDTANFESIKNFKEAGLIDGVTTNPTHLSKEGGDILELLHKICDIMNPMPVSIEVTEKTPEAIFNQALKINQIASNVAVKVPCHKDYILTIKKLLDVGVKINITLLFSLTQALFMAKLGVQYVSPFIGRLDDIDSDGLQLIYDIRQMFDNYNYKTEILAASIRNVPHVHQVALAGSDIATIPADLFDKLLHHSLTDIGMQKFQEDWQKLNIKKFP